MARRDFTARPLHPLTGRRIRIRASSQRELEAYLHRLDQLRSEMRLGLVDVGKVDAIVRRMLHGAVTLERAAQAYLAQRELAENTRRRVRSLMTTHLRELLPLELSALDGPRIDRWLRALDLSPSSVRLAWWTLRAIASAAVTRGWSATLPWGAFRPRAPGGRARRRREAARTPLELWRLLEAAGELEALRPEWRGLRAKIATVALLGLRQGELAGLLWGDFRVLEDGSVEVTIQRQYRGLPVKGRPPPAVLAVPPELALILREHGAGADVSRGAPVFVDPRSPEGRGFRTRAEALPRVQLRAAVERAGLPAPSLWTCHSLRDTFATLEAHAHGGDLATVAQRTRHRSLSSLARYLRTLREPAPAGARLPPHFIATKLEPEPRALLKKPP